MMKKSIFDNLFKITTPNIGKEYCDQVVKFSEGMKSGEAWVRSVNIQDFSCPDPFYRNGPMTKKDSYITNNKMSIHNSKES